MILPPEKFKINVVDDQAKGRIRVPPLEEVKQGILNLVHNHPIVGHLGCNKTLQQVQEKYYWPGMKEWITEYVKGCAICQQNKVLTHRKTMSVYRIPTEDNTCPFQQVARDLITRLPQIKDQDAILTIVDQGCSRAAVFLPCSMTIMGPGIVKLYHDHIFRWFSLPTKIISDRDPQFTSHFSKALTKKLGIKQNISMAFHPQTDGLSERKNQWVKQYLRLVTLVAPEDWMHWLALASAIHNNQKNMTTGLSPNQILLGYDITLNPGSTPQTPNESAEE
jgi:hypothetical protein